MFIRAEPRAITALLRTLTTLAKILAGGLPGGCVAGRADILAGLEFRPGKPKMKHPGTFNANPLSAAAGVAALRIVADGRTVPQANDMARLLRQRLNALFQTLGVDWVVYGEFSGFKLLPRYQGPPPPLTLPSPPAKGGEGGKAPYPLPQRRGGVG